MNQSTLELAHSYRVHLRIPAGCHPHSQTHLSKRHSRSRWNYKLIIGQLRDRLARAAAVERRRVRRKVKSRERIALRAHLRIFRWDIKWIFIIIYDMEFIWVLCEFFQVLRLPLNPVTGEVSNGLTLCFAAKEKKQKSEFKFVSFSKRSVLDFCSIFNCSKKLWFNFQNVSF